MVKYYLNGDIFSNLEGHKAEVVSADIIVTFLPEDVVDGLYSAVGRCRPESGKPYRSEYWFILDKDATCVVNSFEIPLL